MSEPSSRRWVWWLLAAGGLLVIATGATGAWAYRALLRPVGTSADRVSVTVIAGQSADEIARTLEDRSIISSSLALRGYLRVTSQSFQAGIYTLTPGRSSIENVQPMLSGAVAERQVTIPEGLRLHEIAKLLEQQDIIPAADLIAAARYHPATVELPTRYNLKADTFLEGFLFPDTYRFAAGSSATDILKRLMTTYLERTARLPMDYETLILASIVEREAKFDADRPLIASVYRNRLAIGMALQADPTVQYAVANARHGCADDPARCTTSTLESGSSDGSAPLRGPRSADEGGLRHSEAAGEGWWHPLTADDLTIDSPYNTYQQSGLPPRPICNPGLASLSAAAAPAETDYLYFVTDKDGRAHFARTLDEHNANVAQYLR